jgi:hypothetical protein
MVESSWSLKQGRGPVAIKARHARRIRGKKVFADGICPRQAKLVFGGISQVLTAAVVLVMVCPHEIAALRILIGEGVAALNAT